MTEDLGEFDQSADFKRAEQQLRAESRELMRRIRRIHPENCTPTNFAYLQSVCVGLINNQNALLDRLVETFQTFHDYPEINGGGCMPEWSRELMEELSEGLGDEFKDL